MALEFEWDPRKAAANLVKHKVSFDEAATVEERFVLLGISRQRRLLAVMYVERAVAVRIISARPATRPERKDYEEITR